MLFKYTTLLFLFVAISCNSADNQFKDTTESVLIDNNTRVDSLINSISKDSVALNNMLNTALYTDDIYAQLRIYANLGSLYEKDYNYKNAIEYYKKSLEHAKHLNDSTQIIKAYNKIASSYIQINGFNEASEYIFKALKIIESYGKENYCITVEKAAILRELGYIYLLGMQTEDAFKCFEVSLRLEQLNNNTAGEAKSLLYLGSLFEHTNQHDSAYYYYNQSLERNIKLNSVSGMSENYNYIGNLFMRANDFDGAMVYLESSYNIIKDTSDKLNKLKASLALGSFNTKTGNFKEAKINLNEGLEISKELKMPAYLEKSHHLLSELYEKEGKSSLALAERILSDNYGNELRRERNINKILQLRLDYENELHEKEKEQLKQQNLINEAKNRRTIIASSSIIMVLIGFIFIIVKYYRLQRNKNETAYQLEMLKSGFFSNISKQHKAPISTIYRVVERNVENTIKSAKETEPNNLNNSDADFLNHITDIIYREITNTDNIIDTISSEMCISSSQLNRKIKSITGGTTSNFILNVRLNKAKKQLTVTQKLIGEIAMECGFNDFAYFSRSFKKRFGITPTTAQKLQHSVN